MSASDLPFHSERQFRLWEFWVSHSKLLLRSQLSESEPQNLDLVFTAVDFLHIPWLFNGLTVSEADSGGVSEFEQRAGRRFQSVEGSRLYVLASPNQPRGFLAGGPLTIDFNTRPTMARRLNPLE